MRNTTYCYICVMNVYVFNYVEEPLDVLQQGARREGLQGEQQEGQQEEQHEGQREGLLEEQPDGLQLGGQRNVRGLQHPQDHQHRRSDQVQLYALPHSTKAPFDH